MTETAWPLSCSPARAVQGSPPYHAPPLPVHRRDGRHLCRGRWRGAQRCFRSVDDVSEASSELVTVAQEAQHQIMHRCVVEKARIGFQSRGWAEVISPHCCDPFIIDPLIFQWL